MIRGRSVPFAHEVQRARDLYRDHGTGPFSHRLRTAAAARLSHSVYTVADPEDIVEAELRRYDRPEASLPTTDPLTLNWVLPAMTPNLGGVANIIETIAELERRGHSSTIYLSDRTDRRSLPEHAAALTTARPDLKAKVAGYVQEMRDADIAIATSWETVYPLVRYRNKERLFYFIQDYEPYFSGRGSFYELASRTYEMGLEGITLGPWIAAKVREEHGMEAAPFPLAVDSSIYTLDARNGKRDGVFFYARPETSRRGFELGLLALDLFHREHSRVPIHLLGASLHGYNLPFKAIEHGIASPKELGELYNQCSAGLVLSYTNASLLPLEMLAAGCIPVSNDGDNVRLVVDNDNVVYAKSSPGALATALADTVNATDAKNRAVRASQSVADRSWATSVDTIEALLRGSHAGR